MSRYIDADKLMDNIKKWLTADSTESRLVDIDDIAVSTLMEIEEAPTVDVQPVIHAKWVKSDVPNSFLAKCTNCGFDAGARSFKYCPMCSAKMDRGVSNNGHSRSNPQN